MRSRRGLGVLAVCGLVLGMMAISASGAQAGMWMINKANVGTELVVSATVALENEKATLLSTSGANKVAITCKTAVVTSATVGLEIIKGTVNFAECTTEINEKAEPKCNPIGQPVATGGEIRAVLHEKLPYAMATGTEVKFKNEKGEEKVKIEPFATFKFNEETCVALPPAIKVTGTGWLEDCNNEFETEKLTHLVQEAKVPAEKLGGLLFGGNKATIDGSANVTLSDATHKGMTFSGLAE